VVADSHLGDARPFPDGVDRDETVHLAVETHVFEDLPPIRLELAAIIVQRHTEQGRDQPIGDDRGKAAAERVVLANNPPARDNIEALGELVEQARDVGGIILAVAVHRDDDVAAAVLNRRHQGGGVAEIA
jgi:hypothetical protein